MGVVTVVPISFGALEPGTVNIVRSEHSQCLADPDFVAITTLETQKSRSGCDCTG